MILPAEVTRFGRTVASKSVVCNCSFCLLLQQRYSRQNSGDSRLQRSLGKAWAWRGNQVIPDGGLFLIWYDWGWPEKFPKFGPLNLQNRKSMRSPHCLRPSDRSGHGKVLAVLRQKSSSSFTVATLAFMSSRCLH